MACGQAAILRRLCGVRPCPRTTAGTTSTEPSEAGSKVKLPMTTGPVPATPTSSLTRAASKIWVTRSVWARARLPRQADAWREVTGQRRVLRYEFLTATPGDSEVVLFNAGSVAITRYRRGEPRSRRHGQHVRNIPA